MPRRVPLPVELTGRAFLMRKARGAPLGEGRLRGNDLERVFHGVRRACLDQPDSAAARLVPLRRAYAPLLRGGERFSHLSAAALYGLPLGQRSGLPVSAPGPLFLELGTAVAADDLVASGDALVLSRRLPDGNRQRPLLPLERLHDSLAAFAGSRGCRAARAAAALVRTGVESPMETRLRLLVVRGGV